MRRAQPRGRSAALRAGGLRNRSGLKASLQAIGADLVLRRGAAATVVSALARESNAAVVFWTEIAQAAQRELGWREFSRHLLYDRPDLADRNLQATFDAFPWRQDDASLCAWQRGRTGYPVVDAGMRQLSHTGTMHNRVRMVVASFLVKHLLIDWRLGERCLWDTLVDADVGSNPASWQWVAGSGADAAPYFRVFNPVLQGEKFDPNGAYVRRWLGELAGLPAPLIHRPWSATPLELASAGVTLGGNYPRPIVDHKAARERALAAYARARQG